MWKALGISGCPQCLCADSQFGDLDTAAAVRSFTEATAVIRDARRMLLEPGHITAVRILMKQNRLSILHTSMWNPFLALPLVDFDCFPADFLHSV